MFGLTKREQRWAAEQKAAETIVPLLTAAIEARTAMDTNDRIAALEAALATLKEDLRNLEDRYEERVTERDAAVAKEREAAIAIVREYWPGSDYTFDCLSAAIRARGDK